MGTDGPSVEQTHWVGADMNIRVLTLVISMVSLANSTPMWYLCDLCEVGWFSCVIKSPDEQFLNRKKFDSNNVYIGGSAAAEKKTHMEKMLEHFMEKQTGHDVI